MCWCRSWGGWRAPSRLGVDFVRVTMLGGAATGGMPTAAPDAGTLRRATATTTAISVACRVTIGVGESGEISIPRDASGRETAKAVSRDPEDAGCEC
ncbi:hypothetical protein ABZP36_001935 [Zizania latifolia]